MLVKTEKLYNTNERLSRENSAHKFKLLILQKGLTQRQLAKEIGIKEQILSHIIRGIRSGKKYRTKICQILNISEKEIWNGN